MEKSASAESLELPWVPKRGPARRVTYALPPQEICRHVTVESFFLCLVGAILCATGVLALVVSAWSLAAGGPYLRLLRMRFDAPYLGASAGALCIPASFVAVSLHNSKRKVLLPLLVVLEVAALVLFVAAAYLGLSPQNSADNPNRISFKNVNSSLTEAFLKYNKDKSAARSINSMQRSLGCCGIDSSRDFKGLVGKTGPPIFCGRKTVRGCKEVLVRLLYAHTNVLNSTNLLAAANQVFCIIIAIVAWCHRGRESKKKRGRSGHGDDPKTQHL